MMSGAIGIAYFFDKRLKKFINHINTNSIIQKIYSQILEVLKINTVDC